MNFNAFQPLSHYLLIAQYAVVLPFYFLFFIMLFYLITQWENSFALNDCTEFCTCFCTCFCTWAPPAPIFHFFFFSNLSPLFVKMIGTFLCVIISWFRAYFLFQSCKYSQKHPRFMLPKVFFFLIAWVWVNLHTTQQKINKIRIAQNKKKEIKILSRVSKN